MPDMPAEVARWNSERQNHGLEKALDNRLIELSQAALERGEKVPIDMPIRNGNRTVGTMLSNEIARRYGHDGLPDGTIHARFAGSAGQSFGTFLANGVTLEVIGDTNDYCGKGLSGGRIIVAPSPKFRGEATENIITGNVVLYGAIAGDAYFRGVAGERFAVRNSGAIAVIEGAGDHCCEYMTGGVVCVLGRTGVNFGAGFTGGFAYVLDLERDFVDRYNHELIDISRIHAEAMQSHLQHLSGLIEQHVAETGSVWGEEIMNDLRSFIGKFWVVKPKAASIDSLIENLRRAA